MSLTLRIILVLSSIVSFVFCIKKIRTAKLKVENSITWMIGSVILVLMSIFSNAVAWISEKCGFMASSNFVFFVLIAFLLVQLFIDNIKISELNEKIKNLNHHIALNEKNKE